MRHTIVGLSIAVLGSAAGAQSVLDRLPQDPVVRIQVAGPVVWQQRFAETRIAAALADRELQALLKPLFDGLQAEIAQRELATGQRISAVFDEYARYRGRVHMTVSLVGAQGSLTVGAMHVVAPPDGHADFEKIAQLSLPNTQADPPKQIEDVVVDGRVFRAYPNPGAPHALMTSPFVLEDHLVVLCGVDLESELRQFVAPEPRRSYATPPESTGLLSIRIDWRSLLAEYGAAGHLPLELSPRPDDRVTGRVLQYVESASIELMEFGRMAGIELAVRYSAPTTDLLQLLTPADPQSLPRAMSLVPRSGGAWLACTIDLDRVHAYVVSLRAVAERGSAPTAGGDAFERNTGLRLQEDLLAHLGKEIVCCGLPPEELEQLTPHPLTSAIPLHALAMTLHDSASLQDSIERLLRQTGMHAARKQEEYQGATIHRLIVGGLFSVDYAITDRLLAIGIGEPGAILVRRILAESRALATGQPQVELAGATEFAPQPDAEPCLAAAFPLEWLLAWLEQAQDSARSAAARNRIALLTGWTDTIVSALRRAGTENLYVTLHREPQRLVLRLRL